MNTLLYIYICIKIKFCCMCNLVYHAVIRTYNASKSSGPHRISYKKSKHFLPNISLSYLCRHNTKLFNLFAVLGSVYFSISLQCRKLRYFSEHHIVFNILYYAEFGIVGLCMILMLFYCHFYLIVLPF